MDEESEEVEVFGACAAESVVLVAAGVAVGVGVGVGLGGVATEPTVGLSKVTCEVAAADTGPSKGAVVAVGAGVATDCCWLGAGAGVVESIDGATTDIRVPTASTAQTEMFWIIIKRLSA